MNRLLPEGDAVSTPRTRLTSLGLSLPEVSPPKGSYVPAVRTGSTVYVAGQIPMVDGELSATGKVGAEITAARSAELARQCVLAAMAAIAAVTDLDRVDRVLRAVAYAACAPDFAESGRIAEAVTLLLERVFLDSAPCVTVGVPGLPLNSPVEVELTVSLTPR